MCVRRDCKDGCSDFEMPLVLRCATNGSGVKTIINQTKSISICWSIIEISRYMDPGKKPGDVLVLHC